MRSPKVGNQGGETTFSSAFVDRTVQHSAWPIVRVDLPQVVCLGAAPRNATKEVYGPLFDMLAPGIEPGSLDSEVSPDLEIRALNHSANMSD